MKLLSPEYCRRLTWRLHKMAVPDWTLYVENLTWRKGK